MNSGAGDQNKNEGEQDPPKGNLKTCPEDDGKEVQDESKVEETTVTQEEPRQQPYTPSILRTPSIAGSSYSKYFVSIDCKN